MFHKKFPRVTQLYDIGWRLSRWKTKEITSFFVLGTNFYNSAVMLLKQLLVCSSGNKATLTYHEDEVLFLSTSNSHYCMAVAANGSNTEILLFDWFMSGRIFPVLLSQGAGNLKKPCL